jgi:hypothetical protein
VLFYDNNKRTQIIIISNLNLNLNLIEMIDLNVIQNKGESPTKKKDDVNKVKKKNFFVLKNKINYIPSDSLCLLFTQRLSQSPI